MALKLPLLEAVHAHAEQRPDAVAFRLTSTRRGTSSSTWADVVTRAGRAADALRRRGVAPGERVLLMGTHHRDLVSSWLGAVWLGAVPSIVAEPSVRIDRGVYWERMQALVGRIDARILLHDPAVAPTLASAVASYEQIVDEGAHAPAPYAHRDDTLLALQHSSGTTGAHKGVMLSHGAVAAHGRAYAETLQLNEDDIIATWLPLYHDMGFIACFVLPLYLGMRVEWLSPFEWVAAPATLLDVVSAQRATRTWLPNFAFKFLAERAGDGTWDLSSLHSVVSCSEPVTAAALDAFTGRFARCGLRNDAVQACFAMAENVFAVTTTTGAPVRRTVAVQAWTTEQVARDADEGIVHVSSGRALPTVSVRIVDAAGAPLPPRHAGRILVSSPFAFSGYFARADLDALVLQSDGSYDTGDLGWLDEDGELFVTGRAKDLLILAGKNFYPQDIEDAAHGVAEVRPGRAVAFGVRVPARESDGLVVLFETTAPDDAHSDVARRVRGAVSRALDLDVLDCRVVPLGALRKSTSGKLARDGNRDWYLEGRYGPLIAALEPQTQPSRQERS